jgi:hypothetical protein
LLSAFGIRLGQGHQFDLRQSAQDAKMDNTPHVSATD